MSWAQQLTYLIGRRFAGGPNFHLSESNVVDLDGIILEVTLPRDGFIAKSTSQRVNFPFSSQGWFENNCDQLWNHLYVSVLVRSWAYLGPFWKVLNEPFGVLTVSFWLKRAPSRFVLSKDDLETLERVIHADYEDHFESKGPDEKSIGFNTKVRQDAEEMFAPKPYPTSRNLAAEKESYLQKYLQIIPTKFARRSFGGQQWVYYGIEPPYSSLSHHYCFPLSDLFYLDVGVRYRVDFYNYFHLWKAHAESAEERIMNSVRLTFPNS